MDKYGIEPHGLWMRADDDLRRDDDVKRGLLAELRQHWTIVLAVDDNPPVVDLWRTEGIDTVAVPGWDGEVPLDLPVLIDEPDWVAALPQLVSVETTRRG
jgi:hypothetical protein